MGHASSVGYVHKECAEKWEGSPFFLSTPPRIGYSPPRSSCSPTTTTWVHWQKFCYIQLFEPTPKTRAKMPQQIYGFNGSLHFLVRKCCSCGFNGRWHLASCKTKTTATMTTQQPHTPHCFTSAPAMLANKPTLSHRHRAPISSSSKGLKCLFCHCHFKNMCVMGKHSRWCDGHHRAWCRCTPFEWLPSSVIDIDRKAHVPVSTMISLYLLSVHCLILLVPHVKYHILQTINNQIIYLHCPPDDRDWTCRRGQISGSGWIRDMQANAHHFTKSY